MTGPRLGVDFGTSTTIGVVRRPDGRLQPLLFDGSPLLPSAVLLGADGRLHTGRDAGHLARSAPERLEPNPKRRVDEARVLLGDAEVEVADLLGAVLDRVAAEAARVAGPVAEVVLTHPADWGSGRRGLLESAARAVGFRSVTLVAEPLAAATFFTHTHGRELPVGSFLMVYDLGAGTADVTVLRRQPGGFTPVASDGIDDLGGLDVDAAVVEALQATYGELWSDPATRRRLWDDVRSAKEMLSRASGTVIMVPSLGREVPLGREQLEQLARPVLAPGVEMARALLAGAGVRRADIGGRFLVGGSSRMPLVATMLHEALGVAPLVAEQPELVVAEGALRLTDPAPLRARAVAAVPAPVSAPPGGPAQPVSAQPDSAPPVSAAPFGGAPVPVAPFAGAPVSAVPSAGRPVSAPSAGYGRAGHARPRRHRSRTALRVVATIAGLAVLTVAAVTAYHKLDDDGVEAQVPAAARYDITERVDNLCDLVDLTPFQDLFEEQSRPEEPGFVPEAHGSTASCATERVHQRGAVRAMIMAGVNVRANDEYARAVYDTLAGGASVNTNPEQLTGIGTEAVAYTMNNAPLQMQSEMTFVLTAIDGNLVWTLRVTLLRADKAGWTPAEQLDVRGRLTAVTRGSFPRVTDLLRA